MTFIKVNVDLHVHSIYSSRPRSFALQRFGAGECYTTPRQVYDTARGRGMHMVTITDRDTIDGALEIADREGAFVSEEISSLFPEDKVEQGIVALDINEGQHREIQRLRDNIYDVASYLRTEGIAHFATRPLMSVGRDIDETHVQKTLLLFTHLQGRAGSADVVEARALERLVRGLSRDHLERWAERHRLTPHSLSPVRYLVGGSDDYGRMGIARAHTEFEMQEQSIPALREAFFAGRLAPGGSHGTPEALGHNIYGVTFSFFQSRSTSSAFSDILNFTDAEEELIGGSPSYTDRRVAIAQCIQEAVAANPSFSPLRAIEQSHTDKAQAEIGELGRRIVNNLLSRFLGGLVDSFGRTDIEAAFDAVPGLFTAGSVILPYLFGYRHMVIDREQAEKLVEKMGFGRDPDRKPKVAVFVDSGYQVNGVNTGLRRLLTTMREQGRDIEMVVCGKPPRDYHKGRLEELGGWRVMEAVAEFDLPYYQEVQMAFPSLVDVMNYLSSHNVTLVQLSTPGPLGFMGFFGARLMRIPTVANYHTELPAYASQITRDHNIASIVRNWTSWFYGQSERCIAPSKAAGNNLASIGVPIEKIHVIARGVRIHSFDPKLRDPLLWRRYGMGEGPKVLYVGRVSREKGIDDLLAAFELTRKEHPLVELVVVGDGPYLEELQKSHACARIHFLGYRRGDELMRIYASADLFAFPSATDTFGNVIIEAQASGLPVVVVDKGGPAEQVSHGEDGLIVPKGDIQAMGEAIGTLLENEPLRRHMGKSARIKAEGRSIEAAAEAHWRFYLDTCGM
ncbi:MAG: glycosyltransferase [Myxococcota bacterium]|jgi:glycosyltransferase involved in cell wall biosynthesis|nr:glycosyltransferase [Myxococcota bacterium]